MQSVSSRFWTRVAVSSSYDDNHYTTGTSTYKLAVSRNLQLFKVAEVFYAGYIYIYMCVCVCVCTYIYNPKKVVSGLDKTVIIQGKCRIIYEVFNFNGYRIYK